ncbi:MAG: hypothetical protein RSA71_10250, partial [Eubacterium sp.]
MMGGKGRYGLHIFLMMAVLGLVLSGSVLAASGDGVGARVIVCLRGDALSTYSLEDDLKWEPLM